MGLKRKQLRCEQQARNRRQTVPLPGIEKVASPEIVAGSLQQGRRRMDAESALVTGSIIGAFMRTERLRLWVNRERNIDD